MTGTASPRRPVSPGQLAGAISVFTACLLAGCQPAAKPTAPQETPERTQTAPQTLAPGIVFRTIVLPDSSDAVELVDVDLAVSRARPAILAKRIARRDGAVMGLAQTPREWLTETKALAVVNGGYFGREDGAGHKEISGLLVLNGRVRRAAAPLHGRGSATLPPGEYRRAAFALLPDGAPEIAWAATAPGGTALRRYDGPTGRGGGRAWRVQDAVGCGPMLLWQGKVVSTDRAERLVSPGPEPRTFVATDAARRHFVLGIASGCEFAALAAFLKGYFPRYDRTPPGEAMCLDGGSSTQISYRDAAGAIQSPRETGASVPDAVALLPTR